MTTYEGQFTAASDARFAIVASRFNHFIVDRLVEGARDAFARHGVGNANLDLVWVPGAWELPWAVGRLAKKRSHAAIVVVGAVIRGSTPHFDYVAGQAAAGTARQMLEHDVPVVFGLLTTDTIEQAIERAGTKAGNKGFEAALGALELADLGRSLEEI